MVTLYIIMSDAMYVQEDGSGYMHLYSSLGTFYTDKGEALHVKAKAEKEFNTPMTLVIIRGTEEQRQ